MRTLFSMYVYAFGLKNKNSSFLKLLYIYPSLQWEDPFDFVCGPDTIKWGRSNLIGIATGCRPPFMPLCFRFSGMSD